MPEQAADRERSLRVLRSLPADIWVTNHARPWGRYRKFVASTTAKNPLDPFIDPEGYRAFIDAAEAEYAKGACTSSTALPVVEVFLGTGTGLCQRVFPREGRICRRRSGQA
jgi:metallo-beta-lactamase class B